MKTFTTTLALVLTATVMMAFPRGSKLTIEVLGHRPNSVIVLDGQHYVSRNNAVVLEELQAGDYPVEILRPSHWGDQGSVFNGVIHVPQRSDVKAVINLRRMNVTAQPLAYSGPSYWDGQGGGHHYQNPNGNGAFVSLLPHDPRPTEPVVCPPAYIGMHPNAFAGALEVIRSQTFDSDQVRVAKQIIRTNRISSQQIAAIMELMSFESSRLEIAKFGYLFVSDRENYYIVNDVFWFSSSVRELDRYINRC